MIDIVSTFRSYALNQDGSQRPPDEVIPVRVSLLLDAAAGIERLKAALEQALRYVERDEVAHGRQFGTGNAIRAALSGDKQ